MSGKIIALILLIVVALIGIPATLYLVKTQQNTQSNAADEAPVDETVDTSLTVTPEAPLVADGTEQQACQAPGQVGGVSIQYPYLNAGNADFTQANCSWTAVDGATSYVVKTFEKNSESEAGTEKSSQSVPSTQTNFVYPITQNKYSQCDVTAVNSCGTGPAGTATQFCASNAIAPPTGTPTVGPTVPPQPTTPPVATQPPLPPTGNALPVVAIGIIGTILFIIGGALLLL